MDKNKEQIHFELERAISRIVVSKLIRYQVSISDAFYERFAHLYGLEFSYECVKDNRKFFAYVTKHLIFDVAHPLTKEKIYKHISALETLCDISDTSQEFNNYFYRKFKHNMPNLKHYLIKDKELNGFDMFLKQALEFNPKNK